MAAPGAVPVTAKKSMPPAGSVSTPPTSSLNATVNATVAAFVGPVTAGVIVTVGAVTSTVKVIAAFPVSGFPAASATPEPVAVSVRTYTPPAAVSPARLSSA